MNSFLRSVAVSPIWFYQRFISPGLAPRCKYYPSCSSYAISAISIHGLRGLGMATWRLLRCNPWSSGGVDYVLPVIHTAMPKSALTREGVYGLNS